MLNTLESLFNLARERKKSPIDGSYTNRLLSDKSLSKAKVLEEINELIEAVENNSNKVHEAADVLIETLSAPQLSNLFISSTLLIPPPTVNGTKHFFEVFSTTS